jgi:alpha-mannosidase
MKESLLIAKLKNRLTLIEQRSLAPCAPVILSGWIAPDAGQHAQHPFELSERRVWSGARHRFEVEGDFSITQQAHRLPALILRLGRSSSLEKLAFLYGPEARAEIDGEIVFGVDPNHDVWTLPERFADGAVHRLRLCGWTGIRDEAYQTGFLGTGQILDAARELHLLADLCMETAVTCGDDTLRARLLDCLDAALLRLNLDDSQDDEFEKSVLKALSELKGALGAFQKAPLWRVTACGHGHLDLAWLWQTETAKEKAARTISNVLRLMEIDPGFHFSQTQAQLYVWVQERYPALFERIRARVETGQWEILGGMWVEPDCNVTSGESLVRQMLLYHTYMQETFGSTGSPVVWLPDTFGFCAQLPQLMKSAGLLYFSTAKLTWNESNKMPAETFRWRGLDGSEVLSHIVSVCKPAWWGATYSADLSAEELCTTERSLVQKHGVDSFLIAYGMGDGGGGPNESMVRRGSLMEDPGIPGLPRVERGTFNDFFQGVRHSAALPVWRGELYFELHRGTYSGQAETKRLNQRCESALHRAEFLAAWAADAAGIPYPHRRLREAWQSVCLNQFHDILPGSSIHAVYEDAKLVYERVLKICDEIASKSANALGILAIRDAKWIVVNATGEPQSGFVRLPCDDSCGAFWFAGRRLAAVERGGALFIWIDNVPPYGFAALTQSGEAPFVLTEEPNPYAVSDEGYVLENEQILAEFNPCGELVRLLDRTAGRELIAEARPALQWRLFEDRPPDWDAWDIDASYREKGFETAHACRVEPYRVGDIACGLRIYHKIGRSEIRQKIELLPNAGALHIDCELDWHDRQKLLRVAVPVAINSHRASFGTQFGSVERPTHANTSWDEARFETCMQGFADLSEGDYGMSIACDCKYGVRVFEDEISMTVQKGAVFPDETAEEGVHKFAFHLIPHAGSGLTRARRHSAELKNPLCAYTVNEPDGTNKTCSFINCDQRALVIDTVKRAETDDATIIRAYEAENTRGKAKMTWYRDGSAAQKTSILEEPVEELRFSKRNVEVGYTPFEILTLKLYE